MKTRKSNRAAIPAGYLSPSQVSRRLRVSVPTVRGLMRRGKLPSLPVPGARRNERMVPEAAAVLPEGVERKRDRVTRVAGAAFVADGLDDTPVLYGLLTRADVAELERRRKR